MTKEKEPSIADKLCASIRNLPPMPGNVFKLRQAAADPDVNYDAIVPLLKEDPSLCADLLRIANSARYGVGHRVDTIEESVRYFGMHSLCEFIAAACSEKIIREAFRNIKNLNNYLTHSRQISKATAYISRAMNVSSHEQEVYAVTGLLHDIGRLVIILFTEEKKFCSEFLKISFEDIMKFTADEREIFGIDHAMLGTMICRKWKFPESIIEGVARHHNPVTKDSISIAGLVIFFSEIISIEGISDTILSKAVPPNVFDASGMTPEKLIEARNLMLKDASGR